MPSLRLPSQDVAGFFRLAVWSATLCLGPSIFAADIFDYQGPFTKAHGGSGVIMSRGGASTLHNPANIWTDQQPDFYVDFSPSRLSYEFTPPDPEFSPGGLTVPAPFLSIGGSIKSPSSPVGVGVFFAPTGAGNANRLNDFPVNVGGQLQQADLEDRSAGFKTGFALAFRLNRSLSLGLSALYDFSDSTSRVFVNDDEFLKLINRGRSIRALFGVRYHLAGVGSFALTYQPEKKLHYDLKAKALGSDSVQVYQREFRPTVYGLGFHLSQIAGFEPFFQYTHERWVSATFIAQSPTQILDGDLPVEFLNTNNFVFGTRYRLTQDKHLIGSFSMFQKNKGDGLADEDGTVLMQGRSLQDFEALDRTHITLAYEMSSKQSDWLFYGSYIQASALSAEGTPSAGFYDLNIIMIGLGYVKKLKPF